MLIKTMRIRVLEKKLISLILGG